jgi:hypothetical protein
MTDEDKQPEKKPDPAPPLARPPCDIITSFLGSQRRTQEIVNPRTLGLLDPSWLKAMSGAAAMPEVTRLFSRDYNLTTGVFADVERTRRILGGFNPALDASRQMRALGVGAFPAFHEATLARQRIAQLIQPLDITSLTRDLVGVSDAVTSVASMIRPPGAEFGRDVAAIASSALVSWRSYVDAMPSALDVGDLFGAQAAARGVLGVTASSAILLGDDEAIEVAEEWELAPVEARERMRDGLARISPQLVVRLDGAWDAVAHAGPDSASQAANSAIELIDWTLRLACDLVDGPGIEAWILEQSKPSKYRDQHGRPTRAAKINYLLRESPFESEFVAATVGQLAALHCELQKLKHKHGAESVDAVARLLPSVEAVLFLIVD